MEAILQVLRMVNNAKRFSAILVWHWIESYSFEKCLQSALPMNVGPVGAGGAMASPDFG